MASCLVGQQPGAHEAAHPPWAAFAVALSLALPAAAGNGRSVKGLISSISAHGVAVKGSNSIVTSCALARVSPSLSGYAVGDPVQMVCRARKGRLVLARIRHLERSTAPVQNETAPTYFGGAITALDDSSLTVHDGDRDLTCGLDASSPSTTDFELGQHVKVECAGGKLIAIAAITQADAGRYYVGTVNALDGKGLTLQTEPGLVTCTIGAGSPSTAELKLGDRIGMGCKASTMQLVLIRKLDGTGSTPPPPARATPTTIGARGAVSSISASASSVQTDGGTVTCQLGSWSPALGDLSVGNHVSIKCLDGVLATLERLP
jgi:hypothetical protein